MRARLREGILFICALILLPTLCFSQYILNGNATQNSCNCYTLTQPLNWQAGSVWNSVKIDLTRPFDYVFDVNLGCLDGNGADGIVFMLQPISTSLGTGGGGMGFQGVTPSIGITLDTWQNTEFNDPTYDHISIQANGVIQHGTDLAGPVQASASTINIEDCNWHLFRITWDPSTNTLSAYFDGDLRVSVSNNIIATIFNNDPMVYWGFSSATGGAFNLQEFCTALNPEFTMDITANATCIGSPVTFSEQSQSFAPIQSWLWDFGDGNTSTLENPPPHVYAQPGTYQVSLTITGLDGCVSQPLFKTITIGSKPVAAIEAYDTCYGLRPRLIDRSTNDVGVINNWSWYMDGSLISNSQFPSLPGIVPGVHDLKLVVRSVYGCESDTAYSSFTIKPVPNIEASVADGCVNFPVQFNGIQNDNITTITEWHWNFGDGQTSVLEDPIHTYSNNGNFTASLWTVASNGCSSDTVHPSIFINRAVANAGRDTMVLKGIPFQLNGSGGATYSWSPATALSDPTIANPIATPDDDIIYELTVTTAEGCVDIDSVTILVFKGSAIYVPTGFTPNGDGRNEMLKPRYIGIQKLEYFRVYNRWGTMIYQTNDLSAGWDGMIRGVKQPTGTFVWMVKAEDFAGKVYMMHGTSTIIR